MGVFVEVGVKEVGDFGLVGVEFDQRCRGRDEGGLLSCHPLPAALG